MSEQLYPFEKNRYYHGKMLTSADFRAEQRYIDNKRMFLNQMVLGKGVLCGLSVRMLNEKALLIESGAALDGMGREIIIPKNIVKKLTTLEKGKEVSDGWMGLYLRRVEEETQPVCVVNHDEEYENNRIQESYEFFFSQIARKKEKTETESDFFREVQIFECEDYIIRARIPSYVCRETWVRISFEVEKMSDEERELSFTGTLKLPAFLSAEGTQDLTVSLTDIHIKRGEKEVYDYWLYTRDAEFDSTSLIWEKDTVAAEIDGEQVPFEEKKEIVVRLSEYTPEELVQWETGQITLEERNQESCKEAVRLADILLTYEDKEFVISDMREAGTDKYIVTPATERRRNEYLSYYMDGGEPEYNVAVSKKETDEKSRGREELCSFIRGGTLEIPLDLKMRKGKICYSEEIIHGLGPGNVYVDVGMCEPEDTAGRKKSTDAVVYGDNSLFADRSLRKTCAQTAVKVFRSRGSFQVAARLTGEQNSIVLPLCWTAIRIPDAAPAAAEKDEMQIIPETPTVRLAKGERHYFAVRFRNMAPCSLHYELLDADGGEIGPDGIYTAPAKIGIYEIRISCMEYRGVCTYVYAVVGGKNEP